MWQDVDTLEMSVTGQWFYTDDINLNFELIRIHSNLSIENFPDRLRLGAIIGIFYDEGLTIHQPKTFICREISEILNLSNLFGQVGKIGIKRIDDADLVWTIKVEVMPLTNPNGNNLIKSSTVTTSDVDASIESTTLLEVNANRVGATIWNKSSSNLYIDFDTVTTVNSFAVKLVPDAFYELPFGFTGIISGIWEVANGKAVIREFV